MVDLEKIKELREKTLAPLGECRRALSEAGGNSEEAIKILIKRGKDIAEKKSVREMKEGIIETYIHTNKKIGAMVELGCETDFVARNKAFQELAHNLAMQVAATNPVYLKPEDIPLEALKKRKQSIGEQFREQQKSEEVLDKIIEGKIEKENQELCLLKQLFVKDPSKTIEQLIREHITSLGENIEVKKFVRFEI